MMETRNHFSTSHRFYVCLHRSHRKSARTSKFFKYLVILCNVRRGTPLHHQRHPTKTTTQSKRMINEKRNVSVCAPIFRSLPDFFVCYVWSAGIGFVSVQHNIITCNVQALSGSMSCRRIFFSLSFFFRVFSVCLLACFTTVRIRSGGRILLAANNFFQIAFRYVRIVSFVFAWTGSEVIQFGANIHCNFTRQTITISFTFFGINYGNFLLHSAALRAVRVVRQAAMRYKRFSSLLCRFAPCALSATDKRCNLINVECNVYSLWCDCYRFTTCQ